MSIRNQLSKGSGRIRELLGRPYLPLHPMVSNYRLIFNAKNYCNYEKTVNNITPNALCFDIL